MEMTIEPSKIIFAMINFLVLFLILKHFLFQSVTEFMKNRRDKIENDIYSAKKDKEDAFRLKEENQKLLINSAQEGKEIVGKYKEKAEKVYDEILNNANTEAKRIIKRAEVDIQREKEKAQQEVKEQVIDLSIVLSEKVLEKAIDEKEHRKIIEDFIAKVGI
ncbi:F0F1 ATP synthase subunit B [Clostridium sp. KNHs214]|uniref:F0F1 ATP synthase subunit B n=1 Tax=Clostridium sp. KNHs214 TaxID=1540257 RepID=UPI000691A396|nr:F0F1 ATP synthase subunit B [Clostridium sp. KNHs214]